MSRDWLTMLIPTRGRPQAAAEVLAACDETDTHSHTTIVFGVDSDDPTLEEYDEVVRGAVGTSALVMVIKPGVRRGMVAALNQMVKSLPAKGSGALGFMGDDHRPRTTNWDLKLLDALGDRRYAVAYGDDLLQGVNLATAVVMTEDIPRELGYMAPPELIHLYVDNAWMDWGRATSLTYVPDVVLEHMHPAAGKGNGDEGYELENSTEVNSADRIAYEKYCSSRLAEDVAKLVGA
jgi:hypothetical protein